MTDKQIHQSVESVVKYGRQQCVVVKNDVEIADAAFDLIHSINSSQPDSVIRKNYARLKALIAARPKAPKLPKLSTLLRR